MISMMKDDVAVSLASNSPSGVEETPAGHSAGDSNAASNSPDQRMSVQSPDPDRLPPVQPFPRALTEAPRADSAQSRGPTRDLDVAHNSSSNGIGAARGVLPAAERPSIAGRIFRGVASFLIMTLTAALTAFLISFALTHGDRVKEIVMTWGSSLAGSSSDWQSRGDEAKMMVKEAWASSIKWLIKNSPLRVDTVAKQKGSPPTGETSKREAALSASVAQRPAPVAVTVPIESLEQFKTMAQDLNVVRQKLEQLTAGQQEMAQKIASLQALQQDSKQKEPSPLSAPAAPIPFRKNERTVAAPQAPRWILRDWWITHARNGYVYVQGHGEIYRVVPGTPLPGLGAVEQIKRENGRWVVMTPKGIIASMRDPESDEDMFDGN
jgi:F0F1-type ATP synthase membrane subunit c/vacuolar-type H+-ATPase subunit K